MEKKSQFILKVDIEAGLFLQGTTNYRCNCYGDLEHPPKLWLSSVILIVKSCYAHLLKHSYKCVRETCYAIV